MSQQIPSNKLSIYLIKEEYSVHKDILKDFDNLKSQQINTIGTLYYTEAHIYEPSWIKGFFGSSFNNSQSDDSENRLDQGKLKLFNAGSKAILITEIQCDPEAKRIFAIPFGYGRFMLNNGVWEERFGLKVTLNTVDPNYLRSIDKQSMSSVPKHAKEQISRDGVAADFGIDIEQDLIQSITGKSREKSFGKTITGKDSFNVSTKVDLSNIKDFLKACYEKFRSNEYKKDFSWIDQIAEIKDPQLVEELNGILVENIKSEELDKIWMAVPEIVDWADVSGFKYRNRKEEETEDDIDLPGFLNSLPEDEKENLSIDILKKRRVFCFSASTDELKHEWRGHNCLYCEIIDDKKKKTYLLSNSKWYEVESSFAQQINSDFQHLRDQGSSSSFPHYKHKNENNYNEKVAQSDSKLCCMDKKIISHGGGYSKIEFCDLLTKNNEIIHVKRYGGSSVLSHLFNQGVVSGELFLGDSDFRHKVNDILPYTHKLTNPDSKPRSSDYQIVFAIISSSNKKLEIPFFSKVSLRNAKRRLETYGYKVSLQKISVGD